MQIECSNCGARQRFKYSAANVNNLIAFGWNSFGSELYCPKCSDEWKKRYGEKETIYRPMAGRDKTVELIDKFAERQGVI